MEGIFLRKKFNIWLILLFLCGLFFIGMYIFFNIVDPEATSELLAFLVMGILMLLVVIPSWSLNYGAFIQVDENSIKAKYHWSGKIDCKLSDVSFATSQINTLIIQLKNGKTHTIAGIKNPWPLCSFIRRNLNFHITEQPEILKEELSKLKAARKRGIIYVCFGLALMFVNIFLAAFLTGGRELYAFSKTDWTIMAVMGVIELAITVTTFYFALKTGKNNVPIEKLQYAIKRTIIETKPLVPGFVIAVYTDDNYSGRITLFGYPHQSAVYYSVQELDSEYNLVQEYTSDTYESREELPDDFEALIDITKKILQQ